MTDNDLFQRAIALFDAANAQDPNSDEGQPKELLYAKRMSEMLQRFAPDASEAVQLAVRAQHIQRWKVPRNSYSMDRTGYLQWRTGLYKSQAETAGELMKQAGYQGEQGEAMIERVKTAVGKKGLKVNPETQTLEDVADLVFIEHYMLTFAGAKPDYSEEKWIEIVRKTWKKMSDAAHEFALSGKLKLPEPLVPLITKAISG